MLRMVQKWSAARKNYGRLLARSYVRRKCRYPFGGSDTVSDWHGATVRQSLCFLNVCDIDIE